MDKYKLYWFTGQPGSGKTTLSKLLKGYLEKTFDNKYVIVDGDDIRGLFDNNDYSIEGRVKQVEFVKNICRFLIKNDINPIVSMVSPFSEQRGEFITENDGLEIYLHTDEIRGREHFFVDYYEKPNNGRDNVLEIDTKLSVDFCLSLIKLKNIDENKET